VGILSLLRRYPTLRRLWVGAMISGLGDTFTWMALTWYLVERTKSGAAVGTMLLCFSLPTVLTGGLIGKWLDRRQPRPLMITDNIARAVLIALIPIFDQLGWLPLSTVYIIAALMGALSPATQIGTRLLTPHLVPDEELESANAALGLTQQLPGIIGPALAGLAIAAWGAPRTLLLDAVSFLALIAAIATMHNIPREAPTEDAPKTWTILRRYPTAALVAVLSFFFFFAYGPTEAALPLFVKGQLHSNAAGMGMLWSAVGIGGTLGSLSTAWLARFPAGRTMACIAVLWGLFQLGMAFAPSLGYAMAAFFFGGIVWGPYLAIETSFLQRTVDKSEHGLFFGIHTALLAPSMPLGAALGGALLLRLSPQYVLIGVALACLLGGILALCHPGLHQQR
jgi:predicted MFS family arabinose efflux permease